jgi:polyvinyl alcohol dehydrogenase (cytochrome)
MNGAPARARGEFARIAYIAAFVTAFFGLGTVSYAAPESQGAGSKADGAALYAERCAVCHDHANGHLPSREVLANRSPINITMTLKAGVMRPQAAGLSSEQVNAIAAFLTAGAHGPPLSPNTCHSIPPPIVLSDGGWNGWGRDLANSRFQPHAGLDAKDVPRLKLKWAFAYPGLMTWGQPTVVGGRVFVTSTTGQVYALDAKTGCTLWSINASAPVRTAIILGPGSHGGNTNAYFGDISATAHAVDANTGTELWHVRVDEHPMARITGSPVLYRDRLFVPVSSFEEGAASQVGYPCCKFRGSVVALDVADGKILWKRRTIAAEPRPYRRDGTATGLFGPAGGSVWGAPTVDARRGLLYVGTGNDYTDIGSPTTDSIIAISLDTGEIRWVRQLRLHDNWASGCTLGGPCPKAAGPDADFSASAILVTLPSGRDVLVSGQKSGVVYGLDPNAAGKVLWRTRTGAGGIFGGIEWGMAAAGHTVFAASSDSLTNSPDTVPRPGLAAIDVATGKTLWWTPAPHPVCAWGAQDCRGSLSQAVSAIEGVVFAGSQDGHLRAYDAANGKVIWDMDTAQPVAAVNTASAHGGSLDAGGPVIADGVVYVNSGYGQFLGRGGDVLLALSVDGK